MNTKNPGGGTLGSKILSVAGVLILAVGLVILLLAIFYVRVLTHHSVWYLQKFYGTGRSGQVGYDQLFEYARDITNQRNALAVSLYSTVGILTVVLGIVVILWSRDRKCLP
jgi:uncharacterized membrane protein YqiK